jgi:hypothetical protein
MTRSSDEVPEMYLIDEQPFGVSWDEWTTLWWQWFLSIPKENHPIYQPSGTSWAVSPIEPNVLFLVGSTGGKTERTITISAGKAVLLPVINFTTSFSEDPSLRNELEMIMYAKSNIDDIVKKEVIIDGVNLIISENNRVRSSPFDFCFPTNNIYGVKDGPTRGVGDGYWIFFKPLSDGEHNIRTFGSCLSGRIQIDVDTDLIVRAKL